MNIVKLNWLLFYCSAILDLHITARYSGEETLFLIHLCILVGTAHAWNKAVIHTVAYLEDILNSKS